ncbi:TPA: LysR family transcriptional regulator [Burkholderia stabilis]|nr:LysR family transcriptional regulator [Burkholderia stabilis]HDR9649277.1 LysR family transcriptional regulator [Burkholderia stabilis]HDR9679519.1 LysR family transcriptional regulator [Burkholderia stabilis]
MRKLPPLGALRAFESAARHSYFGKAADALCVTHSAISHQVARDQRGHHQQGVLSDRESGGAPVHEARAGERSDQSIRRKP